jgi:hypothetical protein
MFAWSPVVARHQSRSAGYPGDIDNLFDDSEQLCRVRRHIPV